MILFILVMREVQAGETLLGQGDKSRALERFSCAAVLSSLAGPVSKGENLIATVSRMLPDLAAVLQQQFVSDYDATKAHLRKLVAAQPPAQPALTREEMIASLQAAPASAAVPAATAPVDTLEEDSIDDSDEEKEDIQVPEPKEEAKIEEVVEEVVEESKEEAVEEVVEEVVEDVVEETVAEAAATPEPEIEGKFFFHLPYL